MARNFFYLSLLLVCAFFSCSKESRADFPVTGTSAVLFAGNREAQEGALDFSSHKKLEYRFDDSFFTPPNGSLLIEYEIYFQNGQTPKTVSYSLGLNTGGALWNLPVHFDTICFYAIPIDESFD